MDQALWNQLSNITNKTKATVESLQNILKSLMHDANSSDNKSAFFSFDEETKKKQSIHLYNLFSSYIPQMSPLMNNISDKFYQLSSLFMAADRAMDIDLVRACERRFHAFEDLERHYYEYARNIEDEFKTSNLTRLKTQ